MFSRCVSRISKAGLNNYRLRESCSPAFATAAYHQLLCNSHPLKDITSKDRGCTEINSTGLHVFLEARRQIHHGATSATEDQLDPFSLVADELSLLANRLRSMVIAEVPKLASGAEYFFKMGVEGKRFRPTVLLLMATALNMPVPMSSAERLSDTRVVDALATELRTRQQCIAEITEMIHNAAILGIMFKEPS